MKLARIYQGTKKHGKMRVIMQLKVRWIDPWGGQTRHYAMMYHTPQRMGL